MTDQEYLKNTDPDLIVFGKKVGLRITNLPIRSFPEEIDEEVATIFYDLNRNPIKHIAKLERLIERYPQIVTLKNHLFSIYRNSNQNNKAQAVLKNILKDFPDNIYARANQVILDSESEEVDKNIHLLGDPMEISSIIDADQILHVSEYKIYQHAAAIYEAYTNNEEKAKQRLKLLMEMGHAQDAVDQLAKYIAIMRIRNFSNRKAKELENTVEVDAVQKLSSDDTQAPELTHELVKNLFYQKSVSDFSKEDIQSVMDLPRESLTADLEKVVMDSIHRWNHFAENDFDEDTHSFSEHALYFLGALKAEESLEIVLNCLRMGEEFSDYWFSDYKTEIFYPTLYFLGESQLDKLKDFVLEPYNYKFDRVMVSQAVVQIGLHQPERKTEVIQWLTDVIEYHLDHPDMDGIIDSIFLSFTISAASDLRFPELLPLIKRVKEKGWFLTDINGDYDFYEKDIYTPMEPHDLFPLPENIFEFYTTEYKNRKAPLSGKSLEDLEAFKARLEEPVEQLISEEFSNLIGSILPKNNTYEDREDYSSDYGDENIEDYLDRLEERNYQKTTETVIRSEPKVGRNDPCPCGSGKKYKKCCL